MSKGLNVLRSLVMKGGKMEDVQVKELVRQFWIEMDSLSSISNALDLMGFPKAASEMIDSLESISDVAVRITNILMK